MTKIRTSALTLFLLALHAVGAADGAAQLRPGSPNPGMRPEPEIRFYGLGGYAQLDLDELNARLAALDEPYSPVSEDMVVFGLGIHGRLDRFIVGVEAAGMVSVEDSEMGDERQAEFSAFLGSALLGFSIIQSYGFDFYPMVQAGFAGATLDVEQREDPSWDDMLEDPGRSTILTTGTFYGAGGVSMDYTFRGGFFLGVRGTWAWTPGSDSWSDEKGDVLGGPEVDLSGPSVRLLIGFGGRS